MENTRTYEELKRRLDGMLEDISGRKQDISAETAQKAEAYRTAFWKAMCTGAAQNALREGGDGSGGYLVPDRYEDKLVRALTEKNVVRKISRVIQTTRNVKIPIAYGGGSARWINENQPFEDDDPEFGQIEIDAFKLATSILVSDELLEDSGIDLEAYIQSIFAERIGACEEEAFLRGDGNGKPLGLIYQAPVGVVSEKAGELQVDDVFDLQFSVRAPYRKNGVFLCSEGAYLALRKVNTAYGRPMWSAALTEDEPVTLFGHTILVTKYLDDIVPGGRPILFGDFNYYWIGDRNKRVLKRLNERYADRGQVGFQASQRVDARLVLPEAVKALEIRG